MLAVQPHEVNGVYQKVSAVVGQDIAGKRILNHLLSNLSNFVECSQFNVLLSHSIRVIYGSIVYVLQVPRALKNTACVRVSL